MRVGAFPGGIALDSRTNTVYVTGQVTNDVWVIDGRTCNARVPSGCAGRPARVAAGPGARGIALNERTDTIYVANTAVGTVSVIDGSSCNAMVHRGCRQAAPQAPVGISPGAAHAKIFSLNHPASFFSSEARPQMTRRVRLARIENYR